MARSIGRGPLRNVRHRQLRLSIVLSAIAIGQIATSFGIQWYTVAQLGAGAETDALYAGATLPQVLMVVMIEPLGFVLGPMLSVRSESEQRRVAGQLWWLIAAVGTFVGVALALVAPVVVPLLVPGFSESTLELTVRLARIQIFGAVGAGCAIVLSSYYCARQTFVWPALASLIWSVMGWGLLVVGIRQGGVTLAAWVQVMVYTGPILILASTNGWLFRIDGSGMGAIISELWSQVRPLMVSTAYYRTGFVVDRWLTSLLAPGSVVILELAWRIHTAIVRIINQGVTTPVLPDLAVHSSRGTWSAFRKQYTERLVWIALASLGALLSLIVFVSFGHILYGADDDRVIVGALRSQDLNHLVSTLVGSLGVILFGSINHLLMSAFYAQGDTNTPTKALMLTYTIGIALKVLGFLSAGLLGIAVAISVSYLLEGILLGVLLHRRLTDRLRSQIPSPLEVTPVSAGPL